MPIKFLLSSCCPSLTCLSLFLQWRLLWQFPTRKEERNHRENLSKFGDNPTFFRRQLIATWQYHKDTLTLYIILNMCFFPVSIHLLQLYYEIFNRHKPRINLVAIMSHLQVAKSYICKRCKSSQYLTKIQIYLPCTLLISTKEYISLTLK